MGAVEGREIEGSIKDEFLAFIHSFNKYVKVLLYNLVLMGRKLNNHSVQFVVPYYWTVQVLLFVFFPSRLICHLHSHFPYFPRLFLINMLTLFSFICIQIYKNMKYFVFNLWYCALHIILFLIPSVISCDLRQVT